MAKAKPRLLTEKETNILTGKALVGAMTAKEQLQVMEHINLLYHEFDILDDEDFFGTEGWRHRFGIEE